MCRRLVVRGSAGRRPAVWLLHVPWQRRARSTRRRAPWCGRRHTITDPLQRRGTSTAGVPLWGPSGVGRVVGADRRPAAALALCGARATPTARPPRRRADAVVALDLQSGRVRWIRQVTPGDVYVSNCRPGNPNCPDVVGPDVDFGSPPMLARTSAGRDLIVIGQKSGLGYALDPDNEGAIVWQYRAGRGGILGGIEWGSAVDGERAYFAVSDATHPQPGGLHAVDARHGRAGLDGGAAAGRVRRRPRVHRRPVGGAHRDSRRGLLGFVRRRAARVLDGDGRGDLVVRYEPPSPPSTACRRPAPRSAGRGPRSPAAWCSSTPATARSRAARVTCCWRSESTRAGGELGM